MTELGFGIVGGGVIGPHHARALQNVSGAGIVAVCDIIPAVAEKFSTGLGVEGYTDIGDMLKRDDLDAVNVCTPSGIHSEIGLHLPAPLRCCDQPVEGGGRRGKVRQTCPG
jgi:predicted dehydrogenase